jgi:hypothetical protein
VVSAQQYNGAAADEKDEVVVETSTITDSKGNYVLFLAAGTYNLVATADGKTPDFDKKTTVAGQIYEGASAVNFQLGATDVGQVAGTVLITGAGTENYATLSFRQPDNAEIIEVKSINVANGGTYTIRLPAGTYTMVASSFGCPTQTKSQVVITKDAQTTLDITF